MSHIGNNTDQSKFLSVHQENSIDGIVHIREQIARGRLINNDDELGIEGVGPLELAA